MKVCISLSRHGQIIAWSSKRFTPMELRFKVEKLFVAVESDLSTTDLDSLLSMILWISFFILCYSNFVLSGQCVLSSIVSTIAFVVRGTAAATNNNKNNS